MRPIPPPKGRAIAYDLSGAAPRSYLPLKGIGVDFPGHSGSFFQIPSVLILIQFLLEGDTPSFPSLPPVCYLCEFQVA